MKKIKIIPLIINAIIPLLIGGLSALIVGDNFGMFSSVQSAPLSPPASLFPVVWSILYILLGVSFYFVKNQSDCNNEIITRVYILNLVLNFFWSIIFFNLRAYLSAFVWIILLVFSTILLITEFYKCNKLAGLMNIPYLLWLLFASYLSLSVYLLN